MTSKIITNNFQSMDRVITDFLRKTRAVDMKIKKKKDFALKVASGI